MQAFIFLFFTAFSTFAATPSPPDQPMFHPSYSLRQAVEDVKFQLHRFQWNSTRSINEEICSVSKPLTEGSWHRICEKAFGSSPNNKGTIYTNYLSFVLDKLLRSNADQRLTKHLMWMKKNITLTQNPEVADFLKGIDFGFQNTINLFETKYTKDSATLLKLLTRHTQANSPALPPFSPQESMLIFLACKFNKITIKNNKKEAVESYSWMHSVTGGISAASCELAATVQRGMANCDDERVPIKPNNQLHRAARLFRKAIEEGSMNANAALAMLMEKHPEVALPNETAYHLYRQGIHDGYPTAANNYAISLNDGSAHTDEYNKAPENRNELNELIARLCRQAIRGGDENGWNELGKMVADGSINKNEYGEIFQEDQRQEIAMRMITTAIKGTTEMGLYNYAFFAQRGVFTKDLNGEIVTDKNDFSGHLYQRAAQNGHKLSLNSLALMVHNGEFKENEKGEKIPEDQRVQESLRMLEKADYPDAWLNYAGIISAWPNAIKLRQKEKPTLFNKICKKTQSSPNSAKKTFLLCRLALNFNPSAFPMLIDRAIESGSIGAFYLLFLQQITHTHEPELPHNERKTTPAVKAEESPQPNNHEYLTSDDDSSLDFPGNTEEDLLKESYIPKTGADKDTPAVQTAAIKDLQPEEHSPQTQNANRENLKALKRTLIQKVEENIKKAKEGSVFVEDAKKEPISITWSPLARNQLMSLPHEQRRNRLPLLIEAAKEFPRCSSLIERLKHRKTNEGLNIYSGRITQEDRLEFTVKYGPNSKIAEIHILSLKGHYTF